MDTVSNADGLMGVIVAEPTRVCSFDVAAVRLSFAALANAICAGVLLLLSFCIGVVKVS